jgi:hypothetical protein
MGLIDTRSQPLPLYLNLPMASVASLILRRGDEINSRLSLLCEEFARALLRFIFLNIVNLLKNFIF